MDILKKHIKQLSTMIRHMLYIKLEGTQNKEWTDYRICQIVLKIYRIF